MKNKELVKVDIYFNLVHREHYFDNKEQLDNFIVWFTKLKDPFFEISMGDNGAYIIFVRDKINMINVSEHKL